MLWQQGHGDEAIGFSNQLPPLHLRTIQIQQGKLEEAASTYRYLVRNQPSAAAHHELAQVLTRLGRTDEARKETAKALELSQREAQ